MNGLADGRRRQVAEVKLHADGTFVRLQVGSDGLARGAFEEAHQMGG